MRYLIFISLLFSMNVFGQTDSISLRLASLELKQRNIELNLTKFRKQERIGIIITTAAGIFTSSCILTISDPESKGKPTAKSMLYFSSLAFIGGVYITLDSHKFIGRSVGYSPNY